MRDLFGRGADPLIAQPIQRADVGAQLGVQHRPVPDRQVREFPARSGWPATSRAPRIPTRPGCCGMSCTSALATDKYRSSGPGNPDAPTRPRWPPRPPPGARHPGGGLISAAPFVQRRGRARLTRRGGRLHPLQRIDPRHQGSLIDIRIHRHQSRRIEHMIDIIRGVRQVEDRDPTARRLARLPRVCALCIVRALGGQSVRDVVERSGFGPVRPASPLSSADSASIRRRRARSRTARSSP